MEQTVQVIRRCHKQVIKNSARVVFNKLLLKIDISVDATKLITAAKTRTEST